MRASANRKGRSLASRPQCWHVFCRDDSRCRMGDDVKKLGPGVKPGHGAILICLEKKAEQVSDACKESVQAKAQAVYDACKLDKDNFCPKAEPGEGRILQCLGQHEAQMSPECKTVWSKVKTAKAKAEAQAK